MQMVKNRIQNRIKPSIFAGRALGLLLGVLCFCSVGLTARAEKQDFEEQDFVIDAVLLPLSSQETYDIRLTVGNNGADWEGTVRLRVEGRYSWYSTAYDTVLSLPQGSTKQFTVRVPREEEVYRARVVLLDRKSAKSAEREFYQLMQDADSALGMGILSDAYSTLTYLDMGGEPLFWGGDDYPIRLVELSQDNLTDKLEELKILVIDRYDTSVLTEEERKAVELWNENGGVLLVGTGSYGEKTLAGLDYLEVDCQEIMAPGESVGYANGYMDFTQLHIAELRETGNSYSESYGTYSLVSSMHTGAVGIVPYALSELGELDQSVYVAYDQKYFAMSILEDVCGMANSRYAYSSTSASDSTYTIGRVLRVLGNGSGSLSFGALRFLVILYVIFVGPVLYLILSLMKKRELYWAAVPVTVLLGIILVFFAGRGFEVVSTRVYSVTVDNLLDQKGARTYLHCYDAGHGEWSLRMAESYEYVGPFSDTYSYGQSDEDYYNHIRREGDRLYFGIQPGSNFEDSYFCAGVSADKGADGGISLEYFQPGQIGTVTNETDCDFLYYVVLIDNDMCIYKNLPAGESCDLHSAETIFESHKRDIDYAYLYDFLDDVLDGSKKEDSDALAALGVGLFSVYPQLDLSDALVIGVTTDWDKTVDDTCSEMSYGCLYTVR